ncbi:hydroxyacid dehydrogenase [Candidatus Micrarchaeota archaeon]|nr:hydroxyacid dehydrogenase [Candidatus Micrarchaeota archaeon]MBI5176968.1 hydroxyacid dehydrogenase [Candidatus Micrarchaeota archaeon]
MARITFFETEEWERDYLKRQLKGHALQFIDGHLGVKSASKASTSDAVGIFIYSPIDAKILSKLPKCRLIATMSTGFDHIDLKACKKRGVAVCNVPSYGENTVAEHAFALILSISRKIPQSAERAKHGDFTLEGLRGFDLKGRTIGILGTGKIGRHVIRMAKGFEMNVVAYDAFPDKLEAKELGFTYASFNKLLERSDVISLHLPLIPSTKHIIGAKAFGKMKRGCVLINTARGALVDTHALLAALKDGTVSYAGLDVLEEECEIKEEKELLSAAFARTCDLKTVLENHLLLNHPRVIITPHNAFNSQEALERILDTTAQNISSFFGGRAINAV